MQQIIEQKLSCPPLSKVQEGMGYRRVYAPIMEGKTPMSADSWRRLGGRDRGSHIQGSSVHNQRIERLHRDTTRCCLSSFYTMFDHMENEGILNLSNHTDVFCLHYAFLPRINRALEGFRLGWNHHCLRTEGNKTPYQIWIAGVIGDAYRGYTAVQDILNPDLTVYGVGRDSTDLCVNDDNETVTVLEPNCPLSEDQISF